MPLTVDNAVCSSGEHLPNAPVPPPRTPSPGAEVSDLNCSTYPPTNQKTSAVFQPLSQRTYWPLFYSEKVKNPNKSHIVKRVILGHWAFLAIAISFTAPHPLLNAFALALLTVSYWCIYEIGYQENDLMGERYETQPILSATYTRYKSQVQLVNSPAPWIWALALAVPGVLLLLLSQTPAGVSLGSVTALSPQLGAKVGANMALWLLLLAAVRVSFWIYNQFNEEARIWIYPILQLQKLFGFTLLAATTQVGTILLMSLVLCRWLHYSIYRCGGDRWQFPINLSCFVLFVTLYGAIAAGSNAPQSLLTWQALAAFIYCLLRSVKAWKKLRPSLGLVTRPHATVLPTEQREPRSTINQPTTNRLLLPPSQTAEEPHQTAIASTAKR